MRSADFAAEEHGNAGAFMLKRWLEYSKTGILQGGIETNREPDSPFEEYVIQQLKAIGCEPVPQVGVAGFFIDIGIRHPSWPHGFIMGVECDGATYHSSKSARDRDRYRQEVLEGLGRHLHRIWSTDWFENPAREAERLRKAIETRLFDLRLEEVQAQSGTFSSAKFEQEPEFELSLQMLTLRIKLKTRKQLPQRAIKQ
jgi:hypothetical protein